MKNTLLLFISTAVFVLLQLIPTTVYALSEQSYKTETNNSIIYVVEKNGTFSHSWQFDKSHYKDNINFSLSFTSSSPDATKIDRGIASNVKRKYLFFKYHGNLPTTALMNVNVSDKFNDGSKLYLYYFNNKTGRLEYIANNLLVKNGMVSFNIKHCSDYILTSSIVKAAIDNPGGMAAVIIFLIILGVLLVAATLFMNSKK